MSKYTKEFKIKLVLEYLSGESGGLKSIAKIYKIPKSTLELWINQYKSKGFNSLSKKLKSNKYTSEFKLSVIQYRQINDISFRQTAEHFDISNGSVICNWDRAYRQCGLSELEDKRGRPKKDMSKLNKKSKNNTSINESESKSTYKP